MNPSVLPDVLASVLLLAFVHTLGAEPPRKDAAGNPLPLGALYRFGDVRWRHGDGISASALSPDGKMLATASKRSVVIWDVKTGERLRQFPCYHGPHHFATPGITFSPDGKRLGYAPCSEFACVWDLESGKEVLRLTKDWTGGSALCHFTPDGEEFAVGDGSLKKGRRVVFWDLKSAKEVRSLPFFISLLSPDATTYVRIRENHELIKNPELLFGDVKTGEEKACWNVATQQNGICNGVAFSPDGKTLAVVHQNKEIQIRTPLAAGVRKTFPVPDSAKHNVSNKDYWEFAVGFSRDGQSLYLATHSGAVHRWDLATGRELPTLKGHQGKAVCCHPLPDGKTVLTTGADGLIRRWDAATGRELSEWVGYAGRTRSAFSPDGRYAAVGDARGRLDLWDAKTGKRLRELRREGEAVNNLAFAPDGKSLAVGLASGEVRFWEVPSGREAKTLRWQEKREWTFAHALLFSPDGRFLYMSDYPSRTWMWEIATGKVVWRAGGECASALSPDGAALIYASVGPRLHSRDAATGKARGEFRLNSTAPEGLGSVITALAFAPDGRRLAAAVRDGKVSLCGAPDGSEIRQFLAVEPSQSRFAHLFGHGNYVTDLAFSPDGRWLLTGGSDDLVRVWEVATGAEVLRRPAHEGGELRVAFGPGGRTALSSGRDGQAYLWDLRPAPLPKATPAKVWDDLCSADSPKAYRAVWALSEDAGAAKFLREKLAPVPQVDPGRVQKLLGDLNSEKFKIRTEAARALGELGELAGPAMEESLKKKLALEVELRLRKLLAALQREPTPAEVHQMRAVQALELAGTPAAREVLRAWANGAPGARLTEDARAALVRLR
jgi:WD40 repeat protein